MKKLGIGILALMFIAVVALPVLAIDVVDDSYLCRPDFWTYIDDRDDNSFDKDMFDDKDIIDDKDGVDFDAKVCGMGFGMGGQSVNGVMFMEKYYERYDLIDGNAYSGSHGILTTQLSAGNANAQSSAVYVDVTFLRDIDLVPVGQSVNGTLFIEKNYMRYDAIGGNAFSGAVGILTTQLSSGNANLQQSIVDIEVNPLAFCHPAPAPICPNPCDPCD
jgi:hypothetical protein